MFFCKTIWPLLVNKEKDARFLIVGRNPPENLKEISRKDPRIQIKGFVEDIRPIMSSVTCYVCPMRLGGGTRLKILDALAMGVPLVANNMACEGIPVENGKHVLFAQTPEEFVNNILNLFGDQDLREELRMNSRRLIENKFDYSYT